MAVTRLRFKLYDMVPAISSFKQKMDKPTSTNAAFLLEKFYYIPEKYHDFLKKNEASLCAFAKKMTAKYIGKTDGGWHTTIIPPEDEIKENRIMQVVLMDKDSMDLLHLKMKL